MHALECFTMFYACALPDSLQCASFKIPKLYDIFEMNSDILVLYKCKSQCKSCFTSVNHALPVFYTVHYTLHLCITSGKHCKLCFTHVKHDLQNLFFLKQAYGQVRSFFLRKTKEI